MALEEAILLNAALCNFHLHQASASLACFKRLIEIQPQHADNIQVLTTMALSCHHMYKLHRLVSLSSFDGSMYRRDFKSAIRLHSRVLDINPKVQAWLTSICLLPTLGSIFGCDLSCLVNCSLSGSRISPGGARPAKLLGVGQARLC
jgi:hypothetical protein